MELTWSDLGGRLDEFEYRTDIVEKGEEMQSDVSVDYVCGHHLVSLINVCSSREAYLMSCYGLDNRRSEQPFPEIVNTAERYKKIAETMSIDDLSKAVDDVIVYGEADDHLFAFWMHRSDRCQVIKMTKVVSLAKFIELHLQHLKDAFEHWNYTDTDSEPIITRIPGEMGVVNWT